MNKQEKEFIKAIWAVMPIAALLLLVFVFSGCTTYPEGFDPRKEKSIPVYTLKR